MGARAPSRTRLRVAGALGAFVFLVTVPFMAWELALLAGWNATALVVLVSVGLVISSADAATTAEVAMREDHGRRSAFFLLVGASLASTLAVGFTLVLAGREDGAFQDVLVALAVVTVVVSWTLVNVVFTLRYAHLHYHGDHGGVLFADDDEPPSYADFAYLAFTIGMCYQVSDQSIRNRRTRRTVLGHALLSYVFGVAIVASFINLVAGVIA